MDAGSHVVASPEVEAVGEVVQAEQDAPKTEALHNQCQAEVVDQVQMMPDPMSTPSSAAQMHVAYSASGWFDNPHVHPPTMLNICRRILSQCRSTVHTKHDFSQL